MIIFFTFLPPNKVTTKYLNMEEGKRRRIKRGKIRLLSGTSRRNPLECYVIIWK